MSGQPTSPCREAAELLLEGMEWVHAFLLLGVGVGLQAELCGLLFIQVFEKET